MKEIITPEYTALVSTPVRLVSELQEGYNGDVDFDGSCFVSSFYGFFISRKPFIHLDTGLIICTNFSIADKNAGVYVASHLITGNFTEDLRLLEGDLLRLEETLSRFGSDMKDRESGLVFGYDSRNSQYKNTYDLLVRIGYSPEWVYKSKSPEEVIVIDHINDRLLSCYDPEPAVIPREIDSSAIANGRILDL